MANKLAPPMTKDRDDDREERAQNSAEQNLPVILSMFVHG